jgi:uncharacterized protein (DUF433 family)
MARYPVNMPPQLKSEAERWAGQQGVSLNQFSLWALAEKVGALNQLLDDPAFPHVTYRRGASGRPVPVIKGTGLRVQTLAVAGGKWRLSAAQIAAEYGLTQAEISEALAFCHAHREEIDAGLAAETAAEAALEKAREPS